MAFKKQYTEKDIETLIRMWGDGYTATEVGNAIGKSMASVRHTYRVPVRALLLALYMLRVSRPRRFFRYSKKLPFMSCLNLPYQR